MATHHDDFKGLREGMDFAGETLVNHGHHLADPGPQAAANVDARADYEEHVGGTSPARAVEYPHYQGSSPKVYLRTPTRTWMLKPYHEGTSGIEHTAHYPLLGWSELTSQGLYHAGGIGDLVQHSHVSMHPVSPHENHPFVSVAFDQERRHPAHAFSASYMMKDGSAQVERPVNLYNDAAKIGFMDFLTNHQDRHSDNLLWGHRGVGDDPENLRALAIDNAGAFQYKAPHQHAGISKPGEKFAGKDHLAYYLLDSDGVSALGKRGMGPWDDEHVLHASEWWLENGPFVRQEFERHLEAIKDKKVRRHLSKSFHGRADALDRFSVAFSAAPKFDLYSPYGHEPRARKVAEAKVHEHEPVAPWAFENPLPFDG